MWPITATPWSCRSSAATATLAPTMPSSATGARGQRHDASSIAASVTRPTARVAPSTVSRCRRNQPSSASGLLPSGIGAAVSLPSWVIIMTSAMPVM